MAHISIGLWGHELMLTLGKAPDEHVQNIDAGPSFPFGFGPTSEETCRDHRQQAPSPRED